MIKATVTTMVIVINNNANIYKARSVSTQVKSEAQAVARQGK